MNQKRKRRNFNHASIARYWRDFQNEHGECPWGYMCDWAEPICMACQHKYPLDGSECKYWERGEECRHSDPLVHWNKWKPEKCHIVPLYLGGADEISNIVLMCSDCHDNQPNSTDKEVTFAYMRMRPQQVVANVKAVVDSVLAMYPNLSEQEQMQKSLEVLGIQTNEK